jgi:hypothetical protein
VNFGLLGIGGFLIGVLVGRSWALVLPAAFATWLLTRDTGDVPAWAVALFTARVAAVGVAFGGDVRRYTRKTA